jgi:polysaccharide biosynthesis protein PslE
MSRQMNTPTAIEIPIRNILHILCKRHRLIFGLFLSAVIVTALYSFLSTPVYEATAQILVKVGRENLYTPPASLSKESYEPKYFSENQEAQTNSEVEILKSRVLAKNIITFIGIENIYPKLVKSTRKSVADLSSSETQSAAVAMDRAVDLFQKSLQVESIKKTNVIQLTFLHSNREMATQALDTLLSKYMDLHLQIHRNAQSTKFFEDQLQTQSNELQETQGKLSAFKKEHGITSSPAELLNQMLKEESELRIALNHTLSEEAETEGRLNKLRAQIGSIPKNVILDHEEADNAQTISNLQSKLAELEAKQTDLLSKYTDDNMLVQNNTKDLGDMRAKIAQQEHKKYSRVHSGLNALYQQRMEELLRNEANYQALKTKKESQAQQLSNYQKIIDDLDVSEMDYNQLKKKVDIAKNGYNTLLVQFDESRMSIAMDLERITNLTILDPAHSSFNQVKPKVLLNIVLSIFLGGIGSLAIAFVLQNFNKTFETPEDVEMYLGLKVLASVPDFDGFKKAPLVEHASVKWVRKLW